MNYAVVPQRNPIAAQPEEVVDLHSINRRLLAIESMVQRNLALSVKASLDSSSKEPQYFLVVESAISSVLTAVVENNLDYLRQGHLTKKRCKIHSIYVSSFILSIF